MKALGAACALGLVLSLSSGCASSGGAAGTRALDGAFEVPAAHIMLANPGYASISRDQLLLIKVSNYLETRAGTAAERSEAFYELGIIYDRLGLETTARSMFMNALSENRKFAAPYNFIGIYFAADGRFQEALDAFDAGLELDPSDAYVNFNRALVLYYAGRFKSAHEDFMTFYRADPNDPYRLLWLYLVESELSGRDVALEALRTRCAASGKEARDSVWGFNIVRLYLGETDERAFFDEIRSYESKPDEFADHLCEAYFYVGKLKELDGRDKLAYDYMQLAAATSRHAFVEYRYALKEIAALRKAHGYPDLGPQVTL